MKHRWKQICGCCAACSVGVTGFALALVLLATGCMANRVIFQPPSGVPQERGATMLEVAPDVKIALKYLPPPPGGKVLLYSHGNAEDLGTLRYRLKLYENRGYGIAAYDYEGYGASGGEPSEEAVYRDIERVWRYLTGELGLAPESIVLYGRSVGSGAACYLAEKVPAGALVLESPFRSAFSVLDLGWLPFDRFPNISRIANVKMPLLVIHGDADKVIDISHGEALYEAAAGPKRFYRVRGAGHNDILFAAGEEYWRQLDDFLQKDK